MAGSSGQPLPEDVRGELGAELGMDMDGVRVHSDSHAANAAETLDAKAFTVGRDVYFGPARYAPRTAEGRRLLVHELTHVAQQSEGTVAGTVQRNGKDVQKQFGGVFTRELVAAAARLVHGTPEAQKLGPDIKKEVDRLLRTRGGWRAGGLLPKAYSYVKGKKLGIRRKLGFARLVPPLTITKTMRIVKAPPINPVTIWQNYQRKKLRRALGGCSTTAQAHHVIPLELWGAFGVGSHVVVAAAMKLGFGFNDSENGICLSTKVHEGSHPNYTIRVREALDFYRSASATDQLLGARVVAKRFKAGLSSRTVKLD
jgi:hypothetical protein